jgi:heme exporter protein A
MTTPAPIQAEGGGTPMIALRGLTKAFGSKVALRGVNLTVMPGESVVIFGPNGAGKSTMIRILCALSRPTGGTVQIGGLDLQTHADGIRKYLGVVSHAPLLYDSLSAEENLQFFAQLYSMKAPDARIAEMLERAGLVSRRKDLVRGYSRGMVQRLAIARALLHDPEILLLDEPDTGLDPQAAEMLHRLLTELSGRATQGATDARRRTIITVTHHLERGLTVADRVIILANGRIAYEGMTQGLSPETLRELYDQYAGGGR